MESVPPEPRERPLSWLAAAGWTLLVRVLFQISLLMTESARPGAAGDLVSVAACDALAYAIVFFAILRVHEPEASVRQVLGVRAPSIALALLAVVAGAALAIPALAVEHLFAARFPTSPEETEQLGHLFAMPTTGRKVLVVAVVAVAIPALDELFFRGVLFTQLKRGRRAEEVILATAAFDMVMQTNLSNRAVLSVLVLSIVLGWIRSISGSVVAATAARIAFFAMQIVPEAIGRELPITRNVAFGSGAVAALALAAAAAIGRRDPRSLDARLDDG